MATRPSVLYAGQIDATDPVGYPHGRAKNDTVVGDGSGTPLEQGWVTDLFGFQQALLSEAGLTPTDLPEKVSLSQYLDAIKVVSRREQQKTQARNWPERASFHHVNDSTTPNLDVDLAWAPAFVAGGGGRFVAINPNNTSGMQVWTSEDGNQFTSAVLNNAARPCVAYGLINGAPGFLMAYASGGHYTSLNGIAWTTVAATLPFNGVACYAASLGLWVIAGDLGELYTSPTALAGSWTVRTTPGGWVAGCGGVKRVVFANGLFVILPLASYNKVLTSSDGLTWTERTIGSTQTWKGLAYSAADGLWMIIAGSTAIATSPNAIAWTVFNHSLALANDLAVINSLWVAPTLNGGAGGIIWSVDKGATWQGVAVGNHRVATAGWNRIIAADDRFLVAHTDGASVEVALSLRAP